MDPPRAAGRRRLREVNPREGAEAITTGASVVQLARNLTRLNPGDLDPFIARWGNWLADTSRGRWSLPSLPDEPVAAKWRGRG